MLSEYRLSFASIAGRADEKASRRAAVAFAEKVPTLRIAAEMKLEVFRNPARTWSLNMLRDIDAMSAALPYCRAIVTDRDAAAMVNRSGAPHRYGTIVTHEIAQLANILEDFVVEATAKRGEDRLGWDSIGPGDGFRCERPQPPPGNIPIGYTVRLCGPHGPVYRSIDRG